MRQLRVTKGSLCKLVSEYTDLPPKSQIRFLAEKRENGRMRYSISWLDDAMYCYAILSEYQGVPWLLIDGEHKHNLEMHIDDLRSRGMIEEV